MITEEIKNIKTDKKELKKFGLTLGIATFFWIGLFTWHRKTWYPFLLILPGTFIFSGYLCPFILKLPYKALRSLFIIINWLVMRLVLCFLFYFVITPTNIIARLVGKKFLDLKFNKDKKSYWILKENNKLDKETYQRQF